MIVTNSLRPQDGVARKLQEWRSQIHSSLGDRNVKTHRPNMAFSLAVLIPLTVTSFAIAQDMSKRVLETPLEKLVQVPAGAQLDPNILLGIPNLSKLAIETPLEPS